MCLIMAPSQEGVRQQYLLGEILRGRYVSSSDPALQSFMNENYTRVEVSQWTMDVLIMVHQLFA